MNIGRGCVVTHVFLESCARNGVGICFVGKCWVDRDGRGTQSHLDYVILGSVSRGTRVTAFVGKHITDAVQSVVTSASALIVVVGDVQIEGVYRKCGARVHEMGKWLQMLQGGVMGK